MEHTISTDGNNEIVDFSEQYEPPPRLRETASHVVGSYEWVQYFETNRDRNPQIPWNCGYILSSEELKTITSSIQEFELGENARGRSFRARGRLYAIKSGDSAYPRALALFIWEEQRHSAYLRRFMEQQGIPLKKAAFADTVFRRIRKLADLDCMISVLVTAEILAMSYYAALYRSTASPTLKAICIRILRDEVPHLRFQGETLGKLRQNRSVLVRTSLEAIQLVLLLSTSIVVWSNHAAVFRAAGMTYSRMLTRSLRFLKRTLAYARLIRRTANWKDERESDDGFPILL